MQCVNLPPCCLLLPPRLHLCSVRARGRVRVRVRARARVRDRVRVRVRARVRVRVRVRVRFGATPPPELGSSSSKVVRW